MTEASSRQESQRPDRRVLRTRGALLELLVERGWDAIDIASICERANIGRSTLPRRRVVPGDDMVARHEPTPSAARNRSLVSQAERIRAGSVAAIEIA